MTHVILVCPPGYLAMSWDVEGGGLIGGYSASLDMCKNDCDDRSDCKAFEHSTTKQRCKLLGGTAPTTSTYQDYQFCKKIDAGKLYMNGL